MSAEYRYRFTEEHLLTSFARHRQQLWWFRPFRRFDWALALVVVVLIIFAVINDFLLSAGLLGGVLGAFWLSRPFNTWIMRRRFRKSPFHDDDIVQRLSADGLHVVGKNAEARQTWAAFTKARRFNDGLLLFQGPGVFYWLPDAASDPSAVRAAEELVRSKIRDYRVV